MIDEVLAAVGDARVVGMGESVHAAADLYRLKHDIFRGLVEQGGFRVFALESGFVEGLVVDAWIKGSNTDLDEILRTGFTYNMGCCQEFADQLEWMRAWNQEHTDDPVHFAGTDPAGWLASTEPALELVFGYLEDVDAEAASILRSADPTASRFVSEAADAYKQLGEPDRHARTAALVALANHLAVSQVAYGLTPDLAVARHAVHLALRQDQYLGEMTETGGGGSARDLGMAETIAWLLSFHGPRTKIVYGAHNGHLQKVPLGFPIPDAPPPTTTAGTFLATMLAGDYVAIGTTFEDAADLGAPGPAADGTVDAVMAASGRTVVDLRRDDDTAVACRAATGHRVQSFTVEMDVGAAWDVLVHVPTLGHMTARSIARSDA